MGRPVGSLNKERPFADALRIALCRRPLALRRVADQLLDKAEQGSLAHIHELIDRLDGKAAQVIDPRDVPIEELSDAELYRIIADARSRPEPSKILLIPPAKIRSDDPT
ncbi:hypothetical protein [Bradyrhizobium sp. McL0616]|uniref:hypothetical protein n=1 Tax=Bradyrhizobium sp. McL0616 TaxID=3415674 RepID=UPI003CF2B5B0